MRRFLPFAAYVAMWAIWALLLVRAALHVHDIPGWRL